MKPSRGNTVPLRRRRAFWLCLLCVPLVAVWVSVVWPAAGRGLSLLVDRVAALPIPTPQAHKIAYDGDFRIGGLQLTVGTLNNNNFDLTVSTDRSNMIVLRTGGRAFTLGPRTNSIDPSGRPDIDFAAERGDAISLTAARGLMGWPTPFETNFMSRTPSWKRYVYYRLVWRKRSGAQLTMFWRYEQDYFSGSGWTRPVMMWDGRTGLLEVNIHS